MWARFIACSGIVLCCACSSRPVGGEGGESESADSSEATGGTEGSGEGAFPVVEVRAFRDSTCARFADGGVRCWGDAPGNGDAQGRLLGDDEAIASLSDLPLPEPARGLAGDAEAACAIAESGSLMCWGAPRVAAPGEQLEQALLPGEYMLELDAAVVSLSINAGSACALLEGGVVQCWGSNQFGVLGYPGLPHNADVDDLHPSARGDLPLAGPARAVVRGDQYTCVALESGEVHCWGRNLWGGMGTPAAPGGDSQGNAAEPFVVDLDQPVVALDAELAHTCALLESGAVRCWGRGNSGQLGLGDTFNLGDDDAPTSQPALEFGEEVEALAVGLASSCARLSDGELRCWGSNLAGALGLGGAGDCKDNDGVDRCDVASSCCIGDDESLGPIARVPLPAAVEQFSVGSSHACALLVDGSVRCWGRNIVGQLGLGHMDSVGKSEPANAAPPLDFGLEP